MEIVVFPDVVEAIVDHLAAELPPRGSDVHVGGRVPNPRPASFVRVIRLGGPRRNLVTDDALVTVESWAADEIAAHDLAQLCRGLLNAMPRNVAGVHRVDEFSGPGSLPDLDSDQARYVQQFSVAMRGTAA